MPIKCYTKQKTDGTPYTTCNDKITENLRMKNKESLNKINDKTKMPKTKMPKTKSSSRKFIFGTPSEAYKSMRLYNKQDGAGIWSVNETTSGYIVSRDKQKNSNRTRSMKDKMSSFNIRNTDIIVGQNPIVARRAAFLRDEPPRRITENEKLSMRDKLKAGDDIVGLRRRALTLGNDGIIFM